MKRNLAIQILCPLFLLIGAGNICQAQELEGKFRIRCAVFVLFSSSCMHVCRPNGRKRRKENSLSHMPSLLRQWKKETIWLMVYYIYKAGGIPHFVLISPEGKILKMWTGYRKGILKSNSKIKLYQARIIIFLTRQKF